MAAISWKNPVTGDWATAANWIPGKVPGAGDAVTIAVPGFYTVNLTTPVKVGSIVISNTSALLAVQDPGQTETVSGAVSNSGALQVDTGGPGGTTLNIGGTLTNLHVVNIGNNAATATTKVGVGGLNNSANSSVNLTGGAVLTVAGSLNNSQGGFLQVDNSGSGGSVLTVGKQLIDNGSLTIGNSGLIRSTTVKAAGLAGAGSVAMNEGTAATATLNITGAAPTTLLGNYNLSGNALIEFGSGGVSTIDKGASLTLNGAKALVALKSAPTSNSALKGLAQNAGSLSLQNGAALATGALDNSNSLSVDGGGAGGSSLTVGGVLTNENSLQIGNTVITKATKVSATALSNFGSLSEASDAAGATSTLAVSGAFLNGRSASLGIDSSGAGGSVLTVGGVLTNNGAITIGSGNLTKATTVKAGGLAGTGSITMNEGTFATATLNITGAAPTTLLGSYNLSGNALIQFGSGGVHAIGNGASLTLNGAKALVALKSAPTSNSALKGLAQNAGSLSLQNGAALATGALDNSNSLSVDGGGAGGSSLTVGGVLTNENSLQIGNTVITKTTKVSAKGLSNFGSLSEVSDAAAATSTLAVSGAFLNGRNASLGIDSSGAGGSVLTVGGVLTNNGALNIGNASLTRATKVKAAGLGNTGTISLTGLTGTATLTATGASSDSGIINLAVGSVLALGNTLTVSGALNLKGGTVSGGTLATAGLGTMQAATAVKSTLSALTIAAGSTFSVAAGGTLVDNGVTVNGSLFGNGGATLNFAKATTASSLINISGFTTIGLANTKNVLTLAGANFTGTAGVITINDGNGGNTVTATAGAITVHAGKGVDVLKGAGSNDIFFAGGKTTMTGGKGANEFVFSAAGNNTITDFTASAANEMLFVSGSGFSLPGATASPQPLGSLFTKNATGAFTAPTQRFAYDTSNGDLFYSGSGTTATEHLVAVVSGHPNLNPAHLLFST
jgi:filamentous hemagglutinin